MQPNTTETHQVFVPLTSFYLMDGVGPDPEGAASIANSWDIPNTDIKLILLSKRIDLSRNSSKPVFNENVLVNGHAFQIETMFAEHGTRLSFNSGFIFSFTQERGQLTIFPHSFENKIRNPLNFLRLYCPGNLFAPYGFIDGKDVMRFHDFYQSLNHGHSSISVRKIESYLQFYERYATLAENLRQKALENPRSVFEGWYKRINNGIYFFSQIYFTSERNQMNPDARDKNNLRLIYLCTALDALIGSGDPNGKKLAEKTDLILCSIKGTTKREVEDFYNERSHYIHANPNTMRAVTLDRTIDNFAMYIQKIILISLELFDDPEFITALTDSNQKHWFSFYEKPGPYTQYSIKKITQKAFERMFSRDDEYKFMDRNVTEANIRHWRQESV